MVSSQRDLTARGPSRRAETRRTPWWGFQGSSEHLSEGLHRGDPRPWEALAGSRPKGATQLCHATGLSQLGPPAGCCAGHVACRPVSWTKYLVANIWLSSCWGVSCFVSVVDLGGQPLRYHSFMESVPGTISSLAPKGGVALKQNPCLRCLLLSRLPPSRGLLGIGLSPILCDGEQINTATKPRTVTTTAQ